MPRSLGLAAVATLAISSGSLVVHAARTTPLGVAMIVTGLVLRPSLVSVVVAIVAGLLTY